MDILAIELDGIQSYTQRTFIPLAKKTVIKGRNDAGKSAIRRALSLFTKLPQEEIMDSLNRLDASRTSWYVKLYLSNRSIMLLTITFKTEKTLSLTYELFNWQETVLLKKWYYWEHEILEVLDWVAVNDDSFCLNIYRSKVLPLIDTDSTTNLQIVETITKDNIIERRLQNLQRAVDVGRATKQRIQEKLNSISLANMSIRDVDTLNYYISTLTYMRDQYRMVTYHMMELSIQYKMLNEFNKYKILQRIKVLSKLKILVLLQKGIVNYDNIINTHEVQKKNIKRIQNLIEIKSSINYCYKLNKLNNDVIREKESLTSLKNVFSDITILNKKDKIIKTEIVILKQDEIIKLRIVILKKLILLIALIRFKSIKQNDILINNANKLVQYNRNLCTKYEIRALLLEVIKIKNAEDKINMYKEIVIKTGLLKNNFITMSNIIKINEDLKKRESILELIIIKNKLTNLYEINKVLLNKKKEIILNTEKMLYSKNLAKLSNDYLSYKTCPTCNKLLELKDLGKDVSRNISFSLNL